MLGGAEKQAMKDTLGEKCISTKVSSHGNTSCPPKVCSSSAFAEQWLPVRGKSWDSPLWCCEAVIFNNVTAASCLWEIHGGNKIVLDYCLNKVKLLRARPVPVWTTSEIHFCCCNSAFPPSIGAFSCQGLDFCPN